MAKFHLFNSKVTIDLDTYNEYSFLYHFVTTTSFYKCIRIKNTYMYMIERDDNNLEFEGIDENNNHIHVVTNYSDILNEIGNQDCPNDYTNAGDYSALDFNGNLSLSCIVDGKSVTAELPSTKFDESACKNTDHFYLNLIVYPDIEDLGYVGEKYMYRLSFNYIEKKIMYEMDLENPLNSKLYEEA